MNGRKRKKEGVRVERKRARAGWREIASSMVSAGGWCHGKPGPPCP